MASPWVLQPLDEASGADLAAATAILGEALPHDGVAVVAQEKLLGGDGARAGRALLARSPGGEVVGVLAQAGRWIKLLCVGAGARRRGVGTALLEEARRALPAPAEAKAEGKEGKPPALRLCDHPGNYLSPGLDERYEEARAFLGARGFRPVLQVQNMRAPVQQNPLVTAERAAELAAAAARRGYQVRRVDTSDEAEVAALLELARGAFAAVWAFELRRALGLLPGPALPEGPGVHAAFDPSGAPVAFAAHDGNNRGLGWFGPMGTLPQHRGQGLGEALLLPCLLDVADRPEGGVIAWVGPIEFYRRACGANIDRQFVVYEEA